MEGESLHGLRLSFLPGDDTGPIVGGVVGALTLIFILVAIVVMAVVVVVVVVAVVLIMRSRTTLGKNNQLKGRHTTRI